MAPSTLFPGTTWEALENRFLLGAGSSYTAGNTGGEATHTLTTNEMPSHSHSTTDDGYVNVDSGIPSPLSSAGYRICETRNAMQIAPGSTITGLTGGGQSHNNMPPYLVVYMWKRTA